MALNNGRLIVNADDFGLTEAVSDAIITVYKNGSASSTSLMTCMPSAAYAAKLAKNNPELGVGLHFALTEGFSAQEKDTPLASGPDRRFFGRNSLIFKILTGAVSSADIRRELEAQYGRLCDLGIKPSHIDGHQHVHIYPAIFKVVAGFAREKGLPLRLPYPQALRRESFRPDARYFYRGGKHWILSRLVQKCEVIKCGLPSNESFNSIFDFYPFRAASAADFQALIAGRESVVHELMVHPYVLSEQLKQVYNDEAWYLKKSAFFSAAQAEFQALCEFSIADWIKDRQPGLRLISYLDL